MQIVSLTNSIINQYAECTGKPKSSISVSDFLLFRQEAIQEYHAGITSEATIEQGKDAHIHTVQSTVSSRLEEPYLAEKVGATARTETVSFPKSNGNTTSEKKVVSPERRVLNISEKIETEADLEAEKKKARQALMAEMSC